MKNNNIAPILLLAGIVLSSCSRTQLLRSTFENDRVGSQPNLQLPEDPVGDVIRYDEAIAPRIRVQNSTISGEKALHFSQIRVPGSLTYQNSWVNFIGVPVNSDKKLRFAWSGQYHHTGFLEEFVQIDISNGAGIVLVRLYFYGNGSIKSVSDIANDAGTTNEKLLDLKKAHAVFVEIDLRTKKYDLNIITADNTINLRTQALATIGGTMPAYPIPFNPKIAFRLDQGVNDYRKYILESVEISQEN